MYIYISMYICFVLTSALVLTPLLIVIHVSTRSNSRINIIISINTNITSDAKAAISRAPRQCTTASPERRRKPPWPRSERRAGRWRPSSSRSASAGAAVSAVWAVGSGALEEGRYI